MSEPVLDDKPKETVITPREKELRELVSAVTALSEDLVVESDR